MPVIKPVFKSVLHAAALFVLCLLLTYAPEILSAVSAPYALSTPRRVLLRIALSTQDADTVSSLNDVLNAYQRAHPAVHLRVVRVDAGDLGALPDPAPDVYLFSDALAGASLPPARPYLPEHGQALLCCASPQALEPHAAAQLIDFLCGPAATPQP